MHRSQLCPKHWQNWSSLETKSWLQPLESRLAELKARLLHAAGPVGQQVDGLRGVISRSQKRLTEAEIAKVEAEATIIKETMDISNYQAQLAELEPLLASSAGFSQGRWTGQRDARVACKHSIVNRQTRAGEQQYRQRRSCTIPSRTAGPSTSAYPTRCAAKWNVGTILPTCAMCRIAGASTRAVQTGHRTRTKCGSQRKR